RHRRHRCTRRHPGHRHQALLRFDRRHRRGDDRGARGAMTAPTGRRRAIAKALTALLPMAPYADMEKIRADAGAVHMKTLPPTIAVWLATIAHVRHMHTDYERLLAEGYDRDSARFFVIGQTNAMLTRWRATRLLDSDDEAE